MMPNETTNTPILTLDSDAKLETAQSISDLTWHEIQNAYRTRRILTGMLGGIEKTENGKPHCRGLLQGFPYCHPSN